VPRSLMVASLVTAVAIPTNLTPAAKLTRLCVEGRLWASCAPPLPYPGVCIRGRFDGGGESRAPWLEPVAA
jgi:hypothetical protein